MDMKKFIMDEEKMKRPLLTKEELIKLLKS